MDGPLSAPVERKHARAATAPDKWRPVSAAIAAALPTPPRLLATPFHPLSPPISLSILSLSLTWIYIYIYIAQRSRDHD